MDFVVILFVLVIIIVLFIVMLIRTVRKKRKAPKSQNPSNSTIQIAINCSPDGVTIVTDDPSRVKVEQRSDF